MARVLIVDDSPVARKRLGDMITAIGHVVVGEGGNGRQALEEYARLWPDIVTMDLTMGNGDGAEATSKILAAYPEARIVVVSAQQERQIILDALERGARHFIIKPVSQEKMADVLNNVMQQTFDKKKHSEFIRRLKDGCGAEAKIPQSARVLIVDDSAVARQSLREIVTALGHRVVGEANNGAQAFVEYARLKPDLVTMDLTMQGLGGAEATSKIVASYPDAKIVVISATELRRGIIDALERGARHFIIKPIRPEKVAAVLKNVLRQDFDLQNHLECVQKLKAAEDLNPMVDCTNKYAPPYAISTCENNLVHVFINQSISLTSCETLFQELQEHLNGTPRVFLDFGTMVRLDQELLVQFNDLIRIIENNSGVVKAVSNNRRLVDTITETQIDKTGNLLASVLRYYEN